MRRLAAIALVAGCGGDPLKADVETFCSASEVTGGKSFMEVGPYIAEHLKGDELKALFAQVRTTLTLDMVAEKVRDMMKRAGVERCPTLDVLLWNRAHPAE